MKKPKFILELPPMESYESFKARKKVIFEMNQQLIKEYRQRPFWVRWFTNEDKNFENIRSKVLSNWSSFRKQ